jgi:hypothetical protein
MSTLKYDDHAETSIKTIPLGRSPLFFFFLYGAAAHIGPWPPLMRFRNLTLIDGWQYYLDE